MPDRTGRRGSAPERDRDADEARRILARVGTQTDGAAMAAVRRTARRAGDHMAGADADQDDWVEVWGTRIGRALGVLLLVGLIVWLFVFVTTAF